MVERDPLINLISSYLKSKGYEHLVDGRELMIDISLDSKNLQVRAIIPEDFPYELPVFHLKNRLEIGGMAHVSWKRNDSGYGDVCYVNKDAVFINAKFPEKVFATAFGSAIATIKESMTNETLNEEELYREYVSVWSFHSKKKLPIWCMATPAQNDFVFLNVHEGYNRFVATSSTSKVNPKNALGIEQDALTKKLGKGVLISLDRFITVPEPTENILLWWKNQLSEIPEELFENLNNKYQKVRGRKYWVILHTVNNLNPFYIGLEFERKDNLLDKTLKLPINEINLDGWNVSCINVKPISPDVLIPRSGGSESWQDKHLCVVGCGSVGSELLALLCSEGIGELTIIDNDRLGFENLHKHRLTPNYLGLSKADGLKHALEFKYPFVKVHSENKVIKGGEIEREINWRKFDAIIWATGNSTIEMRFNEYALEHQIKMPVIYAWNEPFGIGGHAVLTIPEKPGCLGCTYINRSTLEPELYSNLAFLKPGQKTLSEIGGCGFDYVAFSATDATQTAIKVIRLLQRFFNGKIEKSIALSWKGDSFLAESKGLMFTRRFKKLESGYKETDIEIEVCDACH